MGYTPPLSADVTTPQGSTVSTLVGTSNVESIIRANTLDQMGAPAANLSMNTKRLTTLSPGIVATDALDIGQSIGGQVGLPFVVSGCVWTADSSGSTLNGSMTSGTVMIRGVLLTVASVTAHAFTASNDAYIDLKDNGDGTANITYTSVPNWTVAPALAGGGTSLNTIRVAIVSTTATLSTANIGQGFIGGCGAGTQTSTTVAAGSNTQTISALTSNQLAVASSASFQSGGGYACINHVAGGAPYLIQYTGTSAGFLTGITAANVLCGAGTVSTGDAVNPTLMTGVTDSLGNRIYPTSPYPGLVAGSTFQNAWTTTQTASSPVLGANASPRLPFIAPFIVPPGPPRSLKVTAQATAFGTSAVAGTAVQFLVYRGNAQSGGTLLADAVMSQSVASDLIPTQVTGISTGTSLTAGTYMAMVSTQSGAAGTTTVGTSLVSSFLFVELA